MAGTAILLAAVFILWLAESTRKVTKMGGALVEN
jgi:hypothetical protein